MTPRLKLRLIEIREDGSPARCPGVMPPRARDAMEGTAVLYEAVGFQAPWVGYLADRDSDVVGSCAFIAPPAQGRVEIACQTFPEYEGRGIATEMVRQLVRMAREAVPGITVVMQTMPQESAPTRLLRGLGFALEGETEHPDQGRVWQWALTPETGMA